MVLIACAASLAMAAAPPVVSSSGPAAEILRDHVDLEINADGTYAESREIAYRVLNEEGRKALQQASFSYTVNFQAVSIRAAYTLKADGTRIDVAASGMLYGNGASSAPGFQDLRTITVVFPNLEVGDEAVVSSVFEQKRPWFANQFAQTFAFSRRLVTHDAEIAVTAPSAMPLYFDVSALEGGVPETVGSKTRRSWSFHNDAPLAGEPEAVSELDDGPHVVVTSFADYAAVAHTVNDLFADKAKVTPEIQALADQLTTGVTSRREQARILYEWVSGHISYVNIVLGAGGLIPHEASTVLQNRYGDCKDHVMLLGALLAAKGIPSSPVLINAGGNSYHLPNVASPFLFDHLITYVPEFQLYLDSTARVIPFGLLPNGDSGKPVVQTAGAGLAETPSLTAKDSHVHVTTEVTVAADGSASGVSHVDAHGYIAVALRQYINAVPGNEEGAFLRMVMGPGASGTLDRGETGGMSTSYAYAAHFHMTDVASFPGPSALPADIGYEPINLAVGVAGGFPPSRMRAYICEDMTAEEDTTITLPPGTEVLALPKSGDFSAPEMTMLVSYENVGHGVIRKHVRLVADHPKPVCAADYYNRSRPEITKMIAAFKAQILYK